MIYTHLGSFCLFLNWEGAVWPQIKPRKIPLRMNVYGTEQSRTQIFYVCSRKTEKANDRHGFKVWKVK